MAAGTAVSRPLTRRASWRHRVQRHLAARVTPDRLELRERELAEALRSLASSTRSGQSLDVALDAAADRTRGRVSQAMRGAAAHIRLGHPVVAALRHAARSMDVPAGWTLVDVIELQHRRGGDLGHLCHRLATLLYERRRLRDEARSATAQARFTSRAVMVLPLMALAGWILVSPRTLQAMLHPGTAIVVAPAILSIIAGVLVIRRLTHSAVAYREQQVDTPPDPRRLSQVMRVVCGNGSRSVQMLRGAAPGVLVAAMVIGTGGGTWFVICALVVATGCGAAWPVLDARRSLQDMRDAVDRDLASLIELSIALLAAGATPQEVILGSIDGCRGELGRALEPAASHIRLGRSAASAVEGLPIMREAPELDTWIHALTVGARAGSQAGSVLDSLLRDARGAERERFRRHAATIGPRIQISVVVFIVPALTWIVLVATTMGMVRQLSGVGVV